MKLLAGILAFLVAIGAIIFVLQSEHALITHPKGIMAEKQLAVIVIDFLLMLIVIVPTFIALYLIAWKYRSKNKKVSYDPEGKGGALHQLILWLIPVPVIGALIVFTWYDTHALDPFKPLESPVKPLTIQVMALNWKWLFIYPEQGIATINFVQFPAKTPIQFALAADGSPMNSFWIPQLCGQIYAMTGMTTPLHMMANEPGFYAGRAVEINGEGYAGMTFVAHSSTNEDFDAWIDSVKKSPLKLNTESYNELLKPSQDHPLTLYSDVERDLFNKMVMKYMQ